MKKDKASLMVEEWKTIAGLDWKRARRNLKEEDPVAAGFFLQQSLEKFLKAFLLARGWKLRKIHRLDALLDEAVKHNPNIEDFRSLCERVSGYYIADRYPPLGGLDITCGDVKKDLIEAKKFIREIFPKEQIR